MWVQNLGYMQLEVAYNQVTQITEYLCIVYIHNIFWFMSNPKIVPCISHYSGAQIFSTNFLKII